MRKINKVARIVGTVAVGGAAAVSALALTPGTFGGFTSTTTNPDNSVKAGTLTMSNSDAGTAVVTSTDGLALDNLQPGKSATGSVTIVNTGTLPADLKLAISKATNTFPTDTLDLVIKDDAAPVGSPPVYDGTVANVAPITLGGTWVAGAEHTYSVTVTLRSTADNEAQGDTAKFQLDWSGAQH